MRLGVMCGLVLACGACTQLGVERNPFLTYAEVFGIGGTSSTTPGGTPGGAGTEETFRRPLVLTFENHHSSAVLDTSFIAWVEVGNIRSADQQDALLRGGYVQLTQAVQIGTAYTLPVGTFVFDGPGMAGATPVQLAPGTNANQQQGGQQTIEPTATSFTLITPDKILVFSQPPVSCDSVAFTYSVDGVVLAGPVTGVGGYKTLAQVDVYECSPFRPGLFFKGTGGALKPNEYMEGEPIMFAFQEAEAAGGAFAVVTIGEQAQTVQQQP